MGLFSLEIIIAFFDFFNMYDTVGLNALFKVYVKIILCLKKSK